MNDFLKLVYLSIACGAISLVVSKGAIFNSFHIWLDTRAAWLEKVLSCPWCTSHWVSLGLVLVYHPLVVNAFLPLDYLVSIMIMVALASVTVKVIFSTYSSIALS